MGYALFGGYEGERERGSAEVEDEACSITRFNRGRGVLWKRGGGVCQSGNSGLVD